MRKKILITGGLGFIGTNLVEVLEKERDYDYFLVDKVNYASRSEALNFPSEKRIGFKASKVSEIDSEFLNNFDYVIHLAAESSVDLSIQNPSLFMENITELQSLLEKARSCQNIKKIVCVGTDEEYGSFSQYEAARTNGWEESWETPLKPNSPYSSSKASASLVARSYYQTYKLPIVVTRCANNFGPYQNEEKFIPTIVKHLKNQTKIPVYGTGENVREWIHAKDHARGLIAAMESGIPGIIYHFSGESLTNLRVIHLFLSQIDKNYNLQDYCNFVEDRKGHDFIYKLSDIQTQKMLNWNRKEEMDIQELFDFYG